MAAAKKIKVKYVPPNTLIPHKANQTLYGESYDPNNPDDVEILDSVKKRGVITPILVAADGITIVSGHKRHACAIITNQAKVPIAIDLGLTNQVQIELELIYANRQRSKNKADRAREFVRLAQLERLEVTEAGKQEERLGDDPAAVAGFGKRSVALKAAAIMDAVDDLKKRGKVKEAGAIMEDMVNEKTTVGAVYQKHIKAKAKPSKPAPKAAPVAAKGLTPSQVAEAKNAIIKLNAFVKSLPSPLHKEWKGYIDTMRKGLQKAAAQK